MMFMNAWDTESVDPAFWVNVALAVGTIGAALVALWLGLRAVGADKSRKMVETELELRRQAELQAVNVRFTGSGSTQFGESFDNKVMIYNGSDRRIYNVQIGVMINETPTVGQPIEYIEPQSSNLAVVRFSQQAPPQAGFGTFTDAYGRKWSLDSARGLKLETAYPITATKEARATLAKAAE